MLHIKATLGMVVCSKSPLTLFAVWNSFQISAPNISEISLDVSSNEIHEEDINKESCVEVRKNKRIGIPCKYISHHTVHLGTRQCAALRLDVQSVFS